MLYFRRSRRTHLPGEWSPGGVPAIPLPIGCRAGSLKNFFHPTWQKNIQPRLEPLRRIIRAETALSPHAGLLDAPFIG